MSKSVSLIKVSRLRSRLRPPLAVSVRIDRDSVVKSWRSWGTAGRSRDPSGTSVRRRDQEGGKSTRKARAFPRSSGRIAIVPRSPHPRHNQEKTSCRRGTENGHDAGVAVLRVVTQVDSRLLIFRPSPPTRMSRCGAIRVEQARAWRKGEAGRRWSGLGPGKSVPPSKQPFGCFIRFRSAVFHPGDAVLCRGKVGQRHGADFS